MVNPELLEYVRQQLAAGIPKDAIAKSLVTNGWQAGDIQEVLATTSSLPPLPSEYSLSVKDNELLVKKSVWYRILRILIIALGSISLVVTAVFLALRFLGGGGWGLLIAAFIMAPFIEGGVAFCAALFLLYSLLYFLKWKKEGYLFGKIVLAIGILSILPTGSQIYSYIVIHNAYTASDRANPIVTGTQSYDFSKDVTFHTSTLSLNGDIRLAGDTILWPEVTKASPPYPRNVTDLFAFSFDPANSKGTVAQATHFDKTATSLMDYKVYKKGYVLGRKIYWIQGHATGGGDSLEKYDPVSGAQEELLKGGNNDIIFLGGGGGNYLMLSRPITKPDGYSGTAVSLYDVSVKTETSIDEWSSDSVVFGNGYFCHATKNNSIGIYDLNTKKETVVSTAATDKGLGYAMAITGCSRSYAVYTFARESQPGTPATWETHLLKIRSDGSTADELMNMPSPTEKNHFVIVDNYLFFAVNNVIYRKDLSTGDETQIVSSNGLGTWDTDGNYLVYAVTLDKGVALHLQKVTPSLTVESVQKITLGQKIAPTTSSSTKVVISGIKKTYTAGQEAILYTYTISPSGQYNIEETLVPEGNTPQKISGNGSQYDSRIGGYGGAWSAMTKSAGIVPPSGAGGIPNDIPPGSYHIRLDLLPLSLGRWDPSVPIPESVIATTNSSSFLITK